MKHAAIDLRAFVTYKFFNSLFTGLSVGSIFTIYKPLEPSVYSAGGVVLALAMLGVAKLYSRIMNRDAFFAISLGVEAIMLLLVTGFLLFGYGYTTAIIIYVGYQATFAFGAYLVRAETIFFPKSHALTFLDVAKQKGYLFGMALSFGFYQLLENLWKISDNEPQVFLLHFLLLGAQILTIIFLVKAFKTKDLLRLSVVMK